MWFNYESNLSSSLELTVKCCIGLTKLIFISGNQKLHQNVGIDHRKSFLVDLKMFVFLAVLEGENV